MAEAPSKIPILIVAYYWPPSAGSGVQRWLKFVKYLPEHGILPIVLTPENPDAEWLDASLEAEVSQEVEVLKIPVWEPYRFWRRIKTVFKISGNTLSNAPSRESGLAKWIRGNFFLPDPRIFWVKPASTFLEDFIRTRQIKTVITTGPPHSMHLIGLRVKKNFPDVKWVADFRDPWSTWGALKKFKPTSIAMGIHKRMERSVLDYADEIMTISPFYVRQLSALSGKSVHLFTNGFDEEDMRKVEKSNTDRFTIRHVGILHPECDPQPFLTLFKAWYLMNGLNEKVRLVFTGKVTDEFLSMIQSDDLLRQLVEIEAPVSHRDLLKLYGKTDALLLILSGYRDAEGFLPGKLYEYLGTGLPIVAIGPTHGDAAVILEQSGAGKMLSEEDEKGIQALLSHCYETWLNGKEQPILPTSSLKWSRKQVSAELATFLKSLHC